MEDIDGRTSAIAHLNGVALAAVMLAKKRGFDPEIAAMAGMLHDMHIRQAPMMIMPIKAPNWQGRS